MDILFIGNSYTYFNDMPTMFEQLATANGKDVTVRSITKGGRRLIGYADGSDPITAALDALLSQQAFHICFVQEQSLLPAANFDKFMEGLDCVMGKLKGRAENVMLYATWGRKSGSVTLTNHDWTTESMCNLLSEAYEKAAAHYGAQVSPVGRNFLHITEQHPEINLYDEDCSHPSYQGSCLAALTHYHTVFGDFPEHTDALALTNDELSAFKNAVCR